MNFSRISLALSPWGANFCYFFSVGSEVVLIYSIKYMSQAVFQNIRKLYSGETGVAIRFENCMHQYMYCCICRFTICVRCCDTRPIYSLGSLSGIDEMNAGHLKLLGYEVVLQRLQPIPQFL